MKKLFFYVNLALVCPAGYFKSYLSSYIINVDWGLCIEMGLEPVPLQSEYVATNRSHNLISTNAPTNRSRNHHSTHLGWWL